MRSVMKHTLSAIILGVAAISMIAPAEQARQTGTTNLDNIDWDKICNPLPDDTPGLAPADMTGCTVKFMCSAEQMRDNDEHPDWVPNEDPSTGMLTFKGGNTCPYSENEELIKGAPNVMSYVKTGADTATVMVRVMSCTTVYMLTFTSAKAGTMTSATGEEGYIRETRGATFTLH